MSHFGLILKKGTAVLPGYTGLADIAVQNGKIASIGLFDHGQSSEIIDCTGLHILPGVIDTQVHFRDPGADHKETLSTGTKAAAAGGVTAIFDMPNTNPLTITPDALADKMSRAGEQAFVDYAFYLGGTASNAEQLANWENFPGVCGIKIFMGASTGSLLSSSDEEIFSILQNGKRVVAVHAEDEMIMNQNKIDILGDQADVRLHSKWRSPESCISATNRILKLARAAKRRVHVLHITTKEEMDILSQHKDIASVEVLPNHLTLHAPDCYERLGSKAQQNPPIREKEHQDGLWQALKEGVVDIVGSDHAPHTLEEKNLPYPQSPSGTPGVQTLVPVMLNHVNEGRLTLERLVDLVCYGPQRIHQIAGKGRIARGYDADFTIVDMKSKRTISNSQQHYKSKWTPYDGMDIIGWPIVTILRGNIIMRDDELQGAPKGRAVQFREAF